MIDTNIIRQTKAFARQTFKDAEGGHDWFHTLRVYNNALLISKSEKVDNIIVVYRDKYLEEVLKNYKDIKLVFNNSAENGQSEALKTGIQGAGKEGEYIFFVGDQPLISVETINLLIRKYRTNLSDIIVSMYDNKRGNPVLFSNKMKS